MASDTLTHTLYQLSLAIVILSPRLCHLNRDSSLGNGHAVIGIPLLSAATGVRRQSTGVKSSRRSSSFLLVWSFVDTSRFKLIPR
jgi:hypothetical protein